MMPMYRVNLRDGSIKEVQPEAELLAYRSSRKMAAELLEARLAMRDRIIAHVTPLLEAQGYKVTDLEPELEHLARLLHSLAPAARSAALTNSATVVSHAMTKLADSRAVSRVEAMAYDPKTDPGWTAA